MREMFKEGDNLVLEVSSCQQGSINLQIRTEEFGNVRPGVLVHVRSGLVQKMRSHFVQVNGLDCVFGMNGVVWIGFGEDLKELSKV